MRLNQKLVEKMDISVGNEIIIDSPDVGETHWSSIASA
jgi:hypothetical protein